MREALGQPEPALASYDAAIGQSPQDGNAYAAKASLLTRRNRIDDACAAIDAGLAAGAPREPLLLAKALIEGGAGRIDAAVADYRSILSANPNNVIAANNLAGLLADRKPLDKAALADAQRTLMKFRALGDPTVLDTIAWADYRLGDLVRARALLDEAQAGSSTVPDLRFHYAAVLIGNGDTQSGQAILKTVLNQRFSGQAEAAALAQ